METLRLNIQHAYRRLIGSPGFTAVAVLTLAAGIGANVAVFSLTNAVLLRPLPVSHPSELVFLTRVTGPGEWYSFAYPLYGAIRDQNHVFDGVLASAGDSRLQLSTSDGTEPSIAKVRAVSGNYFQVLGVLAAHGRALTPADDSIPGAGGMSGPLAVISDALWRRRFSHDPTVVGRNILLNDVSFTIAGIMPAGFWGEDLGSYPDLWIPIATHGRIVTGASTWLERRQTGWLNIVARVKRGVSIEQARADVDVIYRRYRLADFSSPDAPDYQRTLERERIDVASAARGLDFLRRDVSASLLILMGLAITVLLVACANLANLMFARSSIRSREIAVRQALGASRLRLILESVTESVLLSTLAGVGGLLLARWASGLLLTIAAREAGATAIDPRTDLVVVLFAAGASLVTSLLFGLGPAFRATRVDLRPVLNESPIAGARGRARLRRAALVIQVALSTLLLVGAGLFMRSLQNLRSFDPGFERDGVFVADLDPQATRRRAPDLESVYEALLDRLRAVPGVRSSSLSYYNLMRNAGDILRVSIPGRATERDSAHIDYVSADYFHTVGMKLLAGRDFSQRDDIGAPRVVIVNETFARTYWPGESPIGKRFGIGGPEKSGDLQVAGLVADAKYGSLRETPRRRAFLPVRQQPRLLTALQVRGSGNPQFVEGEIRRIIHEVEPRMPLLRVSQLADVVDQTLWQERLTAALSSATGGIALVLACIGLYGLLTYVVAGRTREFGIRAALGASRSRLLWSVLREAVALVLLGIAIGIPASLICGRLVSARLYGVTPFDPFAIASAVALLVTVALVAAYVPARRASRLDPIAALRGN